VSVEHQGISHWETTGLKLNNGKIIHSDLTIMATGLNAQLLGGIDIFVDEKKINLNDTSWYRGMMFSGIPNLFAHTGYINFSWTARCEIVSERICRTLQYMGKKILSAVFQNILEKNQSQPLKPIMCCARWINFPIELINLIMRTIYLNI
jgi:monooxygenase